MTWLNALFYTCQHFNSISSSILSLIDETESIYKNAGVEDVSSYFILLKAEYYRINGDISKTLEMLDKFQGVL